MSKAPDQQMRAKLVEEAFDLYHVHLCKYAYQLTRHHQDAENLVQDLWRHVLLKFPEGHITRIGLLRRKLYQIFVDAHRKVAKRITVPLDLVPEKGTCGAHEPLTEAEEDAFKKRFWESFPGIALSNLQKDCLWRKARHGNTYKELSQHFGVPISTIADHIKSARLKLRRCLDTV